MNSAMSYLLQNAVAGANPDFTSQERLHQNGRKKDSKITIEKLQQNVKGYCAKFNLYERIAEQAKFEDRNIL